MTSPSIKLCDVIIYLSQTLASTCPLHKKQIDNSMCGAVPLHLLLLNLGQYKHYEY